MSVHFLAVTPVFVVETVEPTRAFFADRLGFTVVPESAQHSAGERLTLERNTARIAIVSDGDMRADGGENALPGPYRAVVYVEVDNVESFVPEVADADVVVPLRLTSAGWHEIGVREPGGNIVMFASRRAG